MDDIFDSSELIQKYAVLDPENLQVQEILDSLRLKFKMELALEPL
ncbi:protein LTO1-like protein [Senna tora]|uniref:Protein LTO1-like protein n=1 Tax=Senna tora TaxID=362788 RepID=A0A834W6C9_9FABA|nr:protein LTO1-like protein [Senna tora]